MLTILTRGQARVLGGARAIILQGVQARDRIRAHFGGDEAAIEAACKRFLATAVEADCRVCGVPILTVPGHPESGTCPDCLFPDPN